MISAALIALALSAPEQAVPGELWLFADLGASLDRSPVPRCAGGVMWAPFPLVAWGGLNEINASAAVMATTASEGNLSLLVWAGYGRPRPRLWFNFEAGLGTGFGWGRENGKSVVGVAPYAPLAAFRVGYGPIALRVTGFIIGGHGRVYHGEFYSLTLEGLWKV